MVVAKRIGEALVIRFGHYFSFSDFLSLSGFSVLVFKHCFFVFNLMKIIILGTSMVGSETKGKLLVFGFGCHFFLWKEA